MKPLILDVCGTLVHGDTTTGLLRHHFAMTGAGKKLAMVRASTARASPLRLGFAALERLLGQHVLKYGLIHLLRGVRVADLQVSAEAYADELLQSHRIERVWQHLGQYPAEARRILASASLEPVVAALAARMGADYVASELEHANGIYTGRLLRDLTGRKPEALNRRFGSELLNSRPVVISDNRTDATLMAAASHAYAVIRRPADRSRWPINKVEFITA